MKVTDEQIREMQNLIISKQLTVFQACKKYGVSTVTYYNRLKALKNREIEAKVIKDKLNTEILTSAENIVEFLKRNIDELNDLKVNAGSIKDHVNIIDKQNKTLVDLLKIMQNFELQKADHELIREQTMIELTAWVFETVKRKGGNDLAIRVLEMLKE